MQKRTIFLTSIIILLTGFLIYGVTVVNATDTQYGNLQDEFHASKIAFEQKEQGYKHEIESLKKLLKTVDKTTLKEREKQIAAVSLANKELEKERQNLLALEEEVNSLKKQIKDFESKVTKADMPDLNDTSKITNIDIDVINEKFKNGALKGQGELLVKVAKEHNISPHFFVALIALESSYGKSKLAKTKNNFGGIKSSKNSYRSFNSAEEGLRYIADLIQRKYHGQGRISIASIQKRYAPTWDGNAGWTRKIQTIMKQIHSDGLS